jgi:hypothetical protein
MDLVADLKAVLKQYPDYKLFSNGDTMIITRVAEKALSTRPTSDVESDEDHNHLSESSEGCAMIRQTLNG